MYFSPVCSLPKVNNSTTMQCTDTNMTAIKWPTVVNGISILFRPSGESRLTDAIARNLVFGVPSYGYEKKNCEAQARVRQGSARDGSKGKRPQSLNPSLELTLKLVCKPAAIYMFECVFTVYKHT